MALGSAHAHEVRPGYLELRDLGAGNYDVLWKVPAKGDRRLGLYVRLPGHCSSSEPKSQFVAGAYIERWRSRCDETLTGSRISIDGLAATRTDVLARVERADGTSQTLRLTPRSPVFTVSAAAGSGDVMKTYFLLGVDHILLGVDHLLFVLALLFLVRNWPRLVGTVTAFTLAHSLTLAAATLGWVHVAQAPVEAAIALSIVFVAAEVLHARQGHPGFAARMPWVVAFVFGLLHGLGFAGALREVGLPEHAIPLALAFFNIGVEAGQLLFIGAFFLLVWTVSRMGVAWRAGGHDMPTGTAWGATGQLAIPAAYVIGTLASFWLIQRSYAFWV
ncbi:MAG: HupE/UreJ family protein [Gammaproteobacteria bacterium]|nr:MAG: HupE/UreJ family protein [Gammaproteobacteria bacterium]